MRQTPVEGVPVMFTVTLAPVSVHDLPLAAPLGDQPLGSTGLTVLVLLITTAILLFQSLRAVLAALRALLLPSLVLLRSLVLVLGLIAVVGFGMLPGSSEPAPDEPRPTPAPTEARQRPAPRPPAVPPADRLAPAAPDR